MPSPFPGMDPYLESCGAWQDFHHVFIVYMSEGIYDILPDEYHAQIQVRFTKIEENYITASGRKRSIRVVDEIKAGYIEIIHRADDTVVTVLELLTPADKTGDGREQYLANRNAVLNQPIHLVELDLLLNGRRLPTAAPLPAGDFYCFVSRSNNRPNSDVFAWPLEAPLPTIPIPLKPPDADVIINIGAVFRTTFDRGRYHKRIKYDETSPFSDASQKRILQYLPQ